MRFSGMSVPGALCVLLALGHAGTAAGTSHSLAGHVLDLHPIASHQSLELKAAYVPSSDLLLVADLFNNGSQNQIDLYAFTAAADGVTPLGSSTALVTGEVFALGDWSFGTSYAAIPFVNSNGGSFDLQVAGYALASGSTMVATIGDSVAERYTSADSSVLANGTFIISALNFDNGTIDYFSSSDEGASWGVEASYALGGSEPIIGAFSGGFRPTSGAVGSNIGTVVQGNSGNIIAAQVDPFDGSIMGDVPIFNHFTEIGNGFLKECDGLTFDGHAFGLCNKGDAAWGGSIDLSDGSLDTMLLNPVGVGATFGFQGVSVSAGIFAGQEQFHSFTDRHVVTPVIGTSWGTPFEATGYPFSEQGGPVDSVTAMDLGRIFVVGLAEGGSAGDVYPAVATMDPALIEAPQQEAGGVAIPSMSAWSMAAFVMLLLAIGTRTMLRRSR